MYLAALFQKQLLHYYLEHLQFNMENLLNFNHAVQVRDWRKMAGDVSKCSKSISASCCLVSAVFLHGVPIIITRIKKNIKNVTGCRDSRSAKSIETR